MLLLLHILCWIYIYMYIQHGWGGVLWHFLTLTPPQTF